PTVTVNWTAWTFDGTPHPASGSVTGVGGANLGTPTFTYYSGSSTAGTPLAGAPSNVGTYTVLASYAGSANYNAASATKTVQVVFRWDGFLQPINDTAHQTGLAESRFRLGQTIPAKFVLKDASGAVVQQSPNPTFSHSNRLGSCDVFVADETITEVVTPNAGNTFAWSGSQYHYNWSTKGLQAGEYRIYANLADGTRRYVDICLTK
ncbi:MAG TPA: PxKF domain-containing protein, partial [Gaiellaceae bacterium]|nr:PxKF domain-containing protein [Gaiellaceae bacterium]